jgi:hypothetical protein
MMSWGIETACLQAVLIGEGFQRLHIVTMRGGIVDCVTHATSWFSGLRGFWAKTLPKKHEVEAVRCQISKAHHCRRTDRVRRNICSARLAFKTSD